VLLVKGHSKRTYAEYASMRGATLDGRPSERSDGEKACSVSSCGGSAPGELRGAARAPA